MILIFKILLTLLIISAIHETGYWFNKTIGLEIKKRFNLDLIGTGLMLWSLVVLFLVIFNL